MCILSFGFRVKWVPGRAGEQAIKRAATIVDIAREAKTNVSTVSRALSGKGRISEATVKRIQRIAKRLNYRPNQHARALKVKSHPFVGVLSRYIDTGFFSSALWGINNVTIGHQNHLMCSFAYDEDHFLKVYDSFLDQGYVGGVLLVAPPMKLFSERTPPEHTKIVLCSARCKQRGNPWSDIPSVIMDSRNTMQELVADLVKSGHKDLVHLAGPADNFDALERKAAFKTAVKKHPRVKARIIQGEIAEADNRNIFRDWIAGEKKWPDAVVAINDSAALAVIDIMKERGELRSSQCSVTGWDNSPHTELQGIASVGMPVSEMGSTCAELLFKQLQNPEAPPPASMTLPTYWHPRKSSEWGAR